MTKRGLQIGGQGRYLFDSWRRGEADARIPAERPRHRHDALRAVVAAHQQPDAVAARPRRLLEPQQGLRRHVLLPTSSDRVAVDVADDAAARRRIRLHARAVGAARARAGASRRCRIRTPPPAAAVQPRAAGARDVARDRLERAHVRRHRRVRALPPADADRRASARYAYPTVAVERQGAGVVRSRRAPASTCGEYDLNDVRPDVPAALELSRSRSRRSTRASSSSATGPRSAQNFVQTLEPRAVLCLRPVPRPEPGADVRYGDRRLQLRAAVQRQPLSRQRPHRRRQPAHAGADVAAARPGHRAPSGCASPSASASTSRTSAVDAERVAALGRRPPTCSSAPRAGSPTRGRSPALLAVQPRLAADRAPQRRRPLHAGARAGSSTRATRIHAPVRRPGRRQRSSTSSTCPAQWPSTPNWTLLGRWNYSLLDSKTLEAVAGVEYNAGLLGAAARRPAADDDVADDDQFGLSADRTRTGSARFGTSPLELLRRSVPGYQQTNDPTRVAARSRDDAFQEYLRFACPFDACRSRRCGRFARAASRSPPRLSRRATPQAPRRRRPRRSRRRRPARRPRARIADRVSARPRDRRSSTTRRSRSTTSTSRSASCCSR